MEEELSSSSYFHLDHSSILQTEFFHHSREAHNSVCDSQTSEQHQEKESDLQHRNLKIQRKRLQKERLSKMTKESTLRAEKRILLRNSSIRKIQLAWRVHTEYQKKKNQSHRQIHRWFKYWIDQRRRKKLNCLALKIQQTWKIHRFDQEQKITRHFSQNGRWSTETSNSVFGLILGYLVRARMRKSPIIAQARRSLSDAWTVLEGLVSDVNSSTQKITIDQMIFILTHNPQAMNNHKTVDWHFARMFIKEVLSSRGIIWDQMIGRRLWSPLPRPGYYYYRSKEKTRMSKPLSGETPQLKETSKLTKESQEKEKRPSNPQSLANLLKAKGKDPRKSINERAEVIHQATESHKARDRDLSYAQRPATAPAHTTNPQPSHAAISPMISTPKRRKVNPLKPHLQIDVISADKLAPVKGKPIGGVTDRKPGFRVHLYLPSKYTPGGDPEHHTSSMKLTQTFNHDSSVETLFPVWNQVIYLNLPIPPSAEHSELLSDALLHDYWSLGYVKIEVVDGERFHEDIFLGEACLLLSSLLSDCQRRDQVPPASNVKSMGGSLPLSKRNPTDRVTGTITAIGYLHLALSDNSETNEQCPNSLLATPSRKNLEKTALENNSSSINRLTPPSKKIPRTPTPPSHHRMPHASPAYAADGISTSERRRMKDTPPIPSHSIPDSGYDEIVHITPKHSQRSESPSHHEYAYPSAITPTPNRPATAPDRKNRIVEQMTKLESLANTLQINAESAVNNLNRKLQDRIDEKNETFTPALKIHEEFPDLLVPQIEKQTENLPGKNRKIVLNSRQSDLENKISPLEDADVLLANLRKRLNEKKFVK